MPIIKIPQVFTREKDRRKGIINELQVLLPTGKSSLSRQLGRDERVCMCVAVAAENKSANLLNNVLNNGLLLEAWKCVSCVQVNVVVIYFVSMVCQFIDSNNTVRQL